MNSSVVLSLVLTFSFGLEAVNCFMFRSISSHAFKGLISQTLFDLDWLSCLEACSRSETCVSYNYNSLTDTEGRGSVCELISGGKYLGECDTSHLVYQTGYVFHRIKLSSKVCQRVPCFAIRDFILQLTRVQQYNWVSFSDGRLKSLITFRCCDHVNYSYPPLR